jgi:hypothetical protein
MWLPLITAAMGTYLMNGYSIIKEHPAATKRKQAKDINPFTCFLT